MAEMVLAEFNSYGARVRIVGDGTSPALRATSPNRGGMKERCGLPNRGGMKERCGPPDRGGMEEGVPEWVRVSRDLMAARCREYEQETGRWPDMTLLERFSAVMGKRLDDFIRDPKGHPWKPMGLAEFERENEGLGIRG